MLKKTRAVDIDCPRGHALAGTVCNGHGVGVDLCQPRINAARIKTQTENAEARRKASK
jgi:hypothetical protein